jgi:hypothetical protein
MKPKPCCVCIIVATSPISLFPSHVVHPEHGKVRVFDVYGRAVCADCGAIWQSAMRGGQAVALVA